MKRFHVILLVGLFLGTAAFGFAQDPKPDEPKAEEPRTPRQDEAKPPKQEPQEKPEKPEKPEKAQKDQMRQQEQARPEENGGQSAHARPAGKSGHIPDDKFKASFGRQHSFSVQRVVTTRTVIVNQTNFVYGGYTFVFLDPWPAEWAFTDDCYVDYIDGEYFLFDVVHPGIRIALFVQL